MQNPDNTFGTVISDFDRVARHLMLEIIVRLEGHKALFRQAYVPEAEARRILDLYVTPGFRDGKQKLEHLNAIERLQLFWRQTYRNRPELPSSARLSRNLSWLTATLGLNTVEQSLLRFCVLAEQHPGLRRLLSQMGDFTLDGIESLFAELFDFPLEEVHEALLESGALHASGMLRIQACRPDVFAAKASLLPGLGDRLSTIPAPSMALFQDYFLLSPPGTVSVADFPHLQEDIYLLESHLSRHTDGPPRGLNVLIHGPSGCGKTEFIKALSAKVSGALFEFSHPGDGLSTGRNELESFGMALRILQTQPDAILMIDDWEGGLCVEAELLHLMEQSFVPTFWVAQQLRRMGPRLLSRFDYVVSMGDSPCTVHENILAAALGDRISPEMQLKIAAQYAHLTPGTVRRAAHFVAVALARSEEIDVDKCFAKALRTAIELPNSS